MTNATPVPNPRAEMVRRYVIDDSLPGATRYLNLLHGNFVELPEHERATFVDALRRDAQQISDEELTLLLQPGGLPDWRGRLTAAWLTGFDRRTQVRDILTKLLLVSEVCFSGQGYCFALAAFGTHDDAEILVSYLARYLPQVDRRYDQEWALGALVHLDDQLGTDHAAPFLAPGGLWGPWSTRYPGFEVDYNPYRQLIAHACSLGS